MKHIITLPALILITLTHSGCRTTKSSNRHQTRASVQEQSEIKTRAQEVNDYSRSESLTDSSWQSYQLTIFPADTFQFSIQNGFIGKASKVVLTGTSKQVIRLIDTSKYISSVTSESEEEVRRDSALTLKGRTTLVEKKGRIWAGIGMALLVGLAILVIWRKVNKERSFL